MRGGGFWDCSVAAHGAAVWPPLTADSHSAGVQPERVDAGVLRAHALGAGHHAALARHDGLDVAHAAVRSTAPVERQFHPDAVRPAVRIGFAVGLSESFGRVEGFGSLVSVQVLQADRPLVRAACVMDELVEKC